MPAVIVTARNEAERLGDTLRALKQAFPDARIVVADDASTDSTPHIALQEEAELVRAPARLGKGGAANLAVERLRRDGPLPDVLLADGDLGTSAGRLTGLVGKGDFVVAVFAKRVGGGFGVALGFAAWVIERLTGLEPRAPISGQRYLSAEAAAAVTPFAPGFGMEIGMTVDAHRAGLRLLEVELDLE
ncbi:MAG: glycosyltransferase family 2 protein, partial [Thermoleophilaceae bacterium]